MSRYRKHRVYQTNTLRPTPRHIRIKTAEVKYKERILKVAGGKKKKTHTQGSLWGHQLISLQKLFRQESNGIIYSKLSSAQFSHLAVSNSSNSMDYSMPGFLVHHQLPELAQTHLHRVGDATQSSHPLLSPSPPAFNLSQHQGLFKWVSSSHQVAKVMEFQLQYQSVQRIFRTDFL